jgi:hypothetical protein
MSKLYYQNICGTSEVFRTFIRFSATSSGCEIAAAPGRPLQIAREFAEQRALAFSPQLEMNISE